jgi:hypothetical protein
MIMKASNFVHDVEFSERLWFCGQNKGRVSGKLRLFNLPFLQQMKMGVLRNNGIYIASLPLMMDEKHFSMGYKNRENYKSKSRQIGILTQKLIEHDNARNRLDFFDLQDLMV